MLKPTRRSRPSARKTPQKDGWTIVDSGQPISRRNVSATETNEPQLHEKRRQKKQERPQRGQLLEDIPVPVPSPSPHQRHGPLLQPPRGVTRAPLLQTPDYRQKIGSSYYLGHGIRRQEQPQSLYSSVQPVGGMLPHSLYSSGQTVGTPTQVIYSSGQPVGTPPQPLYLSGHPVSATPRHFYQSGQPVGTPTQVLSSSGHPVNTTPHSLYSSGQPVGTPPQSLYQSGLPMSPPPQALYLSGQPMSSPPQPLYSSGQPVGGTPHHSLYSSGQPPPAYPSGPTYLQSYPPTPSDSFGALQHNHLPVHQSAHSFIPSSVAPYRSPLAQYPPNEAQQHSGPFYHDGFFDPQSLSRTPHDHLPNRKSYPHQN